MSRDDLPLPQSDPFYTTFGTFMFVPNDIGGTRPDILASELADFLIRKQTLQVYPCSFSSV